MKQDPYWFFNKWGNLDDQTPVETLFKKIEELRTLMEFNDAEGSYWKIKPYLNL